MIITNDRLATIRAALSPCAFDDATLRERLFGILMRHGFGSAVEHDERGANKEARTTLKQALGAAQKLERLLNDPAVGQSLSASMHRRHVVGSLDYDAPSKLPSLIISQALPDLIAALATAAETPQGGDKRRAEANRRLLGELVELYSDATGETVRQPTYDPVTGEIKGRFVEFVRLATVDAWGQEPPSDEALRHMLREIIVTGDGGKKNSEARLYPDVRHGTTKAATQNEVADNDKIDRSPS